MIEVANSRLDNAPYVDLVVEDVGTGTLLLLNQSWQMIKKVKLDFDIIGQKQLTDDEAESWIETRAKGPFKYSLEAKDIQNTFSLDISQAVKGDFPAIVHYMFAGDKEISVDEHGTVTATKWSPRKKVPVTPDFAEWYMSKPKDEEAAPLWIGGQMTSFGRESGEITVDFVAPIPLQPPEVGAGGINYDLVEFIALPIDGKAHIITKRIDMTLKNEKRTFRGLFPITAKQSSFHEIRFTLRGEGQRVLFQSNWADLHVVVSRIDKQAALGKHWSKY
jgi:hypothetical protein